MSDFIPVHEPVFIGNEKKYLAECIDSGWVSSEGNFVKEFEQAFSSYVGLDYGIAVSNGTAALETALYAVGVKPGDEVVMPSFTIISCAIACIRLGAIPVFVDIDPKNWTMNVSAIEEKISTKTAAIMAVHIYGHTVDMDPIYRLQEKYNFKIVEDAAEAQGARYFSRYRGDTWLNCGSLGDVSATSFYANKVITTGEGGMVCTAVEEYAERARSYRNLCFDEDRRFEHVELGYNFRMSNLQAAVGLAQLECIEQFLSKKKQLAQMYRQKIENISHVDFMKVEDWADSMYWMYSVILDGTNKIEASTVMSALKGKGIGSRPFFCGLHRQPALREWIMDAEQYPVTDHAYKYGLYLPSSINLTEVDIDRIVTSLGESIEGAA